MNADLCGDDGAEWRFFGAKTMSLPGSAGLVLGSLFRDKLLISGLMTGPSGFWRLGSELHFLFRVR
jgi:hypothetical protein